MYINYSVFSLQKYQFLSENVSNWRSFFLLNQRFWKKYPVLAESAGA